ncbi:MAG: hypothetical protein P8X57_08570 [Cyclobacteriaceae bacterium]
MREAITDIGIIVGCELLATLVFYLMARWNERKDSEIRLKRLSWRGLFKGWVERGFLVYALISGLPQALTLFAALKIATRIKDDERISNDFYLIGNVLSVCLSIFYTQQLSHYFN